MTHTRSARPSYVLDRLAAISDRRIGDILDVSGDAPILWRHYGDALFGVEVTRRELSGDVPRNVWHFEAASDNRGAHHTRRLFGPDGDDEVRQMLALISSPLVATLEPLPYLVKGFFASRLDFDDSTWDSNVNFDVSDYRRFLLKYGQCLSQIEWDVKDGLVWWMAESLDEHSSEAPNKGLDAWTLWLITSVVQHHAARLDAAIASGSVDVTPSTAASMALADMYFWLVRGNSDGELPQTLVFSNGRVCAVDCGVDVATWEATQALFERGEYDSSPAIFHYGKHASHLFSWPSA